MSLEHTHTSQYSVPLSNIHTYTHKRTHTYTQRSGNVYEGNWHHNERHGDGTMHWYDRGEKYSGQWVKGIQHGHGEHMWIIERNDNAQVNDSMVRL